MEYLQPEEDDIVKNFIEVKLNDGGTGPDFLKIKETLSRIGIASKKENKLFQTCHILHKRGKYYIVHFLEMFMLDGKQTNFTVDGPESDLARRNTIADLLDQWNLLTVIDKNAIQEPRASMRKIKVVPFKEKANWKLEQKYKIGNK